MYCKLAALLLDPGIYKVQAINVLYRIVVRVE